MDRRNTAQQIYQAIGIDLFSRNFGGKNPSYTKKGPGRKHQQSKIKSKE